MTTISDTAIQAAAASCPICHPPCDDEPFTRRG